MASEDPPLRPQRPVCVAVLGGGSWGTTVASLAASTSPTQLWVRDAEVAAEITDKHTNTRYLGERRLHEALSASTSMEEVLDEADVVVFGVPSKALREVARQAAAHTRPWVPLLSLVKGLELGSRSRPSEVIAQELPGHPIGVLSGPNLAREVLDGFAAAAVIAIPDSEVATALQPIFSTRVFRVYRNEDIVGSELGGILKNIIAVAAGMADGLGVGDNTRAMVLTRGLAEITRLGVAMGAEAQTFAGLTGMGDLVATCTSPSSRNRRAGEMLAKGASVEEIAAALGQVAEGVRSASAVIELAQAHDVHMPIAIEVDQVVNHGRSAEEAYRGLRRTAAEHEQHAVA